MSDRADRIFAIMKAQGCFGPLSQSDEIDLTAAISEALAADSNFLIYAFGYGDYDERGGWRDLIGVFDDFDAARHASEEFENAHLVISDAIVASYCRRVSWPDGPERKPHSAMAWRSACADCRHRFEDHSHYEGWCLNEACTRGAGGTSRHRGCKAFMPQPLPWEASAALARGH